MMRFHIVFSATYMLACVSGCSYYTLEPAKASDSAAILEPGDYVVVSPTAMLVRGWSRTGFGVPSEELSEIAVPQAGRDKIVDVPAGTPVTIDRFVRFRQHGLYDCGYDKSITAIGRIMQGSLRGRAFNIEPNDLRDTHLLRPEQK